MFVELDGQGPLHQQVTRSLREAVLCGRVAPGERLPATRTLARELGVSRNTLLQAYEQLTDEGYLVARTGAGTFVASALPGPAPLHGSGALHGSGEPGAPGPATTRATRAPELSSYARRALEGAPRGRVSWNLPRRGVRYDFRYGEPAYPDLPLETWSRLLGRRARRASVMRLAYSDPAGTPELREALAGYLARARGVRCTPERIVITRGSQQAIDLVCRVLIDPGDPVAIEEPHYTGFSYPLAAHGAKLVPIPVDESGLDVDALRASAPVRGVCTTPSHQFPLGGVLPLERRLSLLEHAAETGAFVLEDDYDGEYRFEGRPIPSLQGLDADENVLLVGTASKLLFPALRIGWMVLPEALVRPFCIAKAYADTGSASIEQLVLADFIEGGHLDRHIRRSRIKNAARREALQRAVETHLAGRGELVGTRAGLHGVLRVPGLPSSRESELRRACADRDVGVYPVRAYYTTLPATTEVLLGYGALEPADVDEGVARISEALASLGV
ncbi:MAG: PLP-dependent aminotransferase family protein [Myxococcota bacterium]|nr:PLP-dependent aminotransferase family protein [Myxococcota bacterium]